MADDDNNEDQQRKLTDAEAAIIEFMKNKAALEASGNAASAADEPKEHKFWDTQVRFLLVMCFCVLCIV